jgi:hypothetical protein
LSESEDLGLGIVKKGVSRNGYKKPKKRYSFQDSDLDNENRHEQIFKIRLLTEMINTAFQQFGTAEFLSVDETIVKYYGHNSLKEYIQGKLIGFVYNLWALFGTSGLCFNFRLYFGKDRKNTERDDLLLRSKAVLNMPDCVENPNSHAVFFDNDHKP